MLTEPTETPLRFPVRVGMTRAQLRAISERADLGPLDGRACSEYMVGCALGEPRRALLKRVRDIRDRERERVAAIRAERQPAAGQANQAA
jgi:hypothetical protein